MSTESGLGAGWAGAAVSSAAVPQSTAGQSCRALCAAIAGMHSPVSRSLSAFAHRALLLPLVPLAEQVALFFSALAGSLFSLILES